MAGSTGAATGRGAAQVVVHDAKRRLVADDVVAVAGAGLLTLGEADDRLRLVWAAQTAGQLQQARALLPQGWLAERRRAEAAERHRERARTALPGHARAWLGLVALLVVIWALTTPGAYFWPVWPALGTGTCLLGRIAAARRPAAPRSP